MGFTVTDAMRADIKKAVEELEKVTTGEMVCVVTQSSARYVLFPLLWAALAALLLPLANPLFFTDADGFSEGFSITFAEQSWTFVILAALFVLSPLRHKVTPPGVCITNCRRYAFEQFFAHKLNETNKRSGVMLFVSLDEKYVELLADKGINDKVEPAEWDKIIDDFIADVRTGKVHEGYIKAVKACETVLVRHFPEVSNDVNELSDQLVELPKAEFLS